VNKQFYTIHLLSANKDKPIVFSFSVTALQLLLALLIIMVLATAVFSYFFLPRALQYNELARQNEQLIQDRLIVARILSDYNQIRQMDRYVRSILGADLTLPSLDSLNLDSLYIPPTVDSRPSDKAIEISYLENIPIYPPVDGFITQGFINDRIFTNDNHYGVDIAAATGEPIRAAASGIVVFSDWTHRYGYTVIIYHSHGYFTIYGHHQRNIVEAHQYIQRGDVIGLLGDTGISDGPHLHFEIWKEGAPINPQNMIYSYRRADISVKTTGVSDGIR